MKVFEASSKKKISDEMNRNPVKATKWKGRILFGVESFDVDKPVFRKIKTKKSTYEEREEAKRIMEERKKLRPIDDFIADVGSDEE